MKSPNFTKSLLKGVFTSSLFLVLSLCFLPKASALTQISNCTELQGMNSDITEDYELTQDIDCSATSTWNSNGTGGYYGFDPIGDDSNKFTGSFDGKGYEIQNLYINRPSTDFIGLFAYNDTNIGSITNVGLTNVDITGGTYTGAIAGIAFLGDASDCYATGTVTGKEYTGGLFGYYNSDISDSYFSGTVTGLDTYNSVGGLIGETFKSNITNCHSEGTVNGQGTGNNVGGLIGKTNGYYHSFKVINSYSTADVNSSKTFTGGLVGHADDYSSFEYCYASGDVTSTNPNSAGLVGYLYDHSRIQYSFATGSATGTNYVGGLVGASTPSCPIENSFARGDASGTGWIGGLIGSNGGSIVNSYSSGDVTATTGNHGGLSGGTGQTVTSSYWDTETSGETSSYGGTGRNTTQMMQETTFSGWDFASTWAIDEGNNYPYLQWSPPFDPATEVTVVGSSADYSSSGSTEVLFNNSSGVSQLPDGANSVTLNETQEIDMSQSLATSSASTTVGGGSTTVGQALTSLKGSSVTEVVEVELRAGSGQTGSDITLITDSLEVTMQDQTTMYMENCTDGKITPPIDITSSINRSGWIVHKALNVGNDGSCSSIVHDKVAKVVVPGTDGDTYYSPDNTNWVKITECTDATTSSAGSLEFPNACFIKDSGNTIIWTYHYTTFGNMTSITSFTPENSNPGEATGWGEFIFTPSIEVPASGKIMFMVPEEFTMADDADLTDDLTTFTVGGSNFTTNVSSATLTDNVIEITISSAISADDQIVLRFDNSVFGTNPSQAGEYAISISTHSDTDETLENGYAMAEINNYVNILATVQEALILTLDDTSISLNVDPSVNAGEDYSQKTVLECKTNAEGGYKIQAKLEDSNTGATATLYESATGSTIETGDSIGTENRFGYIGYNSDETKTKSDLKTDATNGAGGTIGFTNSNADLITYQGVGNYLGLTGVTNSQLHTIYYTLNVDYMTVAGIYGATITYTAVPSF